MHTGWWWWGRHETGVDALREWLDNEANRVRNTRWVWMGGIAGVFGGLLGAVLGVMGGVYHYHAAIPYLIPIFIYLGILATSIVWAALGSNRHPQEAVIIEAHNAVQELWMSRWQNKLRVHLGEDGAAILNEGAALVLRSRAILRSPAWKSVSSSETWNRLRLEAERSMDAGMAKLVLLVLKGDHRARSLPILAEMRELAEEVQASSDRHAAASGLPGGTGTGIRETLSELRELSKAEDEFLQHRLGRGN